jgi:hypothetical protein
MMHSFLIAAAKFDATAIIVIIVAAVVALPAFYFVHRGLTYFYLMHARRFCKRNGLVLVRWRCLPEFDKSGTKTEFTIFELDCLDAQKQRRLVRLLISLFGIRKIFPNDDSNTISSSSIGKTG